MLSGIFVLLVCVKAGYLMSMGGGLSEHVRGWLQNMFGLSATKATVFAQFGDIDNTISSNFYTAIIAKFTTVKLDNSTHSTALTITTTNYI